MADPFLDGRPMKLSKNGSDVICLFVVVVVCFVLCLFLFCFCCCCFLGGFFLIFRFFISSQFLQQHFALPVDV